MTARSTSRRTRELKSPARKAENELLSDDEGGYFFDGVKYETYQEMVNAKRKRNQEQLEQSGLLSVADQLKADTKRKKASSQGLKRKKTSIKDLPRRKSSRIAGEQSDGVYIENESGGRFTFGTDAANVKVTSTTEGKIEKEEQPEFYRNRINDGSPISVEQAIENTGPKWVQEKSVEKASELLKALNGLSLSSTKKKSSPKRTKSPTSVVTTPTSSALEKQVKAMEADDEDCVAKVVPDRIYGIAAHPSTEKLIVSAGDKAGFVGIWDVDSRSKEENDGVHLFRFHRGASSCLEWTSDGSALLSGSYDGTVRWFDVESQTFDEVFATYDDDSKYKGLLGAGLDEGHSFWTQFSCLDHRFQNDKAFFLSTSVGTAMHIDMRAKGSERITFYEELSEKKINTLSLHPNGYSLVSGGLDCEVKLWDLRKLGDNRNSKRRSSPSPIVSYHCGKSVNSAFFSPSGSHVVTTTMANKLDIFTNMEITAKALKPQYSIRHDNMTGRWLSTFMARWHPSLDIFCVGSMSKPRCVEIFDEKGKRAAAITGEALTAVASRCCFHPRTDKLVLVGGNSSGRVTIIR